MSIRTSTQVSYPSGARTGTSEVIATVPLGDEYGVVVERTPFHPLDHTWPDQPGDSGLLGGAEVTACLTGATDGDRLFVGEEIPVRRGAEGWHWLVVHVTPVSVRGTVDLVVDADRRHALSAGHTSCHLAALALNAALADRWRKDIAPDGLGRPDFDQTAISSSRISEYASRDVYRLGKSLRRKGFAVEDLNVDLVASQVDYQLKTWVAADVPVWIDSPSADLAARRTWHCSLPEGEASIPCGGTHLTSTGELGEVTVSLELGASELVMETRVTPIAGAR